MRKYVKHSEETLQNEVRRQLKVKKKEGNQTNEKMFIGIKHPMVSIFFFIIKTSTHKRKKKYNNHQVYYKLLHLGKLKKII